MSNIDQTIYTSGKQLFTELTPEEASLLEGGAFVLQLKRIEAIKTDADLVGKDEPYLRVLGKKVWSGKMSAGDVRNINEAVVFDGIANIRLFDKDPFDDDFIDGFNVTGATNGEKVKRLSGNGSKYDLIYTVSKIA